MKDRTRAGRWRRRSAASGPSSQPLRLLGSQDDVGDGEVPEPAEMPKARDLPARKGEPEPLPESEVSEAVLRLQKDVQAWKSR